MAKKSVMQRQLKRQRMVARYAPRRAELKAIAGDLKRDEEERHQARLALQKLPRDASPVRLRNRCQFHARAQGVYRRFGLCRNKLRESAMSGFLPGLVKSSW